MNNKEPPRAALIGIQSPKQSNILRQYHFMPSSSILGYSKMIILCKQELKKDVNTSFCWSFSCRLVSCSYCRKEFMAKQVSYLDKAFCCTEIWFSLCSSNHSISCFVWNTQGSFDPCAAQVVASHWVFPNLWTPKNFRLSISNLPPILCRNLQPRDDDLYLSTLL